MAMKFLQANGPGSPAEIEALGRSMKRPVSKEYASFLRRHNGGHLEPNVFRVNAKTRAMITNFYGASEVVRQKRALSDRLPAEQWPIATTESGNFILMSDVDGSISFWDHETEEPTLLCSSFRAFESIPQPFSVEEVELKPEDVLEVWVHPDFRKE